MGLDNHTALSPAHRRNQNPASPSASFFRRSSTFSREEPDLSWVALLRRHRFLLLMLVVLAFLCTVYLYFAIKLGADNCSGLTGKDEALCRLKESEIKPSHVQRSRRMLLNAQELAFEPNLQNYAHEGNYLTFLVKGETSVTFKERSRQRFLKGLSSFWRKEAFQLQCLHDLRLCEKCTLLKWINGMLLEV